MKFTALFIIALLIAAGCTDSGESILNVVWQNDDVEVIQYSENGSAFTFMRQKNSDMVMEALNGGILEVTGGCTVLQNDNNPATLVWPEGFSIERINGIYRISDGDLIIEAGDSIEVSGGFYAQIPSSYCSGSFWLIGSEIEVLK